jgi:chromosome segregation ATPase
MRIFSTLLEFGDMSLNYEQFAKSFNEQSSVGVIPGTDKGLMTGLSMSTWSLPTTLEDYEEEAQATQRQEAVVVYDAIKVSNQNVAKIVSEHSEKISEAYQEYIEAKKDEPIQKLMLEKEKHDREITNLQKQISSKTEECETLDSSEVLAATAIVTLTAEIEDLRATIEQLKEMILNIEANAAIERAKLSTVLLAELDDLVDRRTKVNE